MKLSVALIGEDMIDLSLFGKLLDPATFSYKTYSYSGLNDVESGKYHIDTLTEFK